MQGYSRAQFLRRGAVAAGGTAAVGLLDPFAAFGRTAGSPRPIPGGIAFAGDQVEFVPANPDIHVLPPTVGFEAATITDFNGVLAAAEVQGVAHGSDGTSYDFDVDMRVMQGWYVDTDDKLKKGTFGFV